MRTLKRIPKAYIAYIAHITTILICGHNLVVADITKSRDTDDCNILIITC